MSPADLLHTLKLGAYEKAFEENNIDAKTLRGLTNDDLKELGVAALGDRKRLLAAIDALRAAEGDKPNKSSSTASDSIFKWVQSWPTPVAVPLHEYASETHPVAKLWAACDAVEMTLRLLVITGVSQKAKDGVLPENLARKMQDILETPTLGGWFVLAQSLMQDPDLAESAWVMGPLRDLLYGPKPPGTPETSFLRLRNRLAHGGGLTRSEAARLLSLWHERFELAFEQCSFFASWELLGRESSGNWRLLRGPEALPAEAPPVPTDAKSDAVWLKRADQLTLLWPLAIFGPPSADSNPLRTEEDKTQVYSRKEAVRLTYTPVGLEGMAQSESGEGALRAFERLFESRGVTEAGLKVASFEPEFRRDAAQMVGRQREVEQVLAAIQETPQGVLWLSGAAGMGKSFLMSKVAVTLQDEQAGSRTLVLAYRFRAGDQARCSREALAQFVVERLQAAAVLKPFWKAKKDEKAAERLNNALGLIADDVRVILLLDGLDEVQRRDEKFTEEVALGVRVPRLVCCCAGRPEPAIEQAMRQFGGRTLFANGLPPMGVDDIRGMLLEKIGPLRKKLLGHDRESGDAVVNPFIELVAKRAAGLPMYVKYVVGDVLANRYRVLDGDESLPDSLHAYHEELLRRLGVGDLQAVVTPLAATLACAYEPLTLEQLEAVFIHRKLIQPKCGLSLIKAGLVALASMVISAPSPEGGIGFTLFHQSLRDHILSSPQMIQSVGNSRDGWSRLVSLRNAPSILSAYRLRNAIQHLLMADRKAEAEDLLLDLGFLQKMNRAGVHWSRIYGWWMNLGGETKASKYIKAVRETIEYRKSSAVLEQSLIVLTLFKNSVWIRSANRLGRILYDWSRERFGEKNLYTLQISISFAELLLYKGDLNLAEKIYIKALEVLKAKHGEDDIATLLCMGSLAGLLSDRGDYIAAEKLSHRVLYGLQRELGPCDPNVLVSQNNLGIMLRLLGRLSESENLHAQIFKKSRESLGHIHLNTLLSLVNLANVIGDQGRFRESETLNREAVEGLETVLGSDHPLTLKALDNLAVSLSRQGNYVNAEHLFRSVLAKLEIALGGEHPETLRTLCHLAITLRQGGNHIEAEALCRRALLGREKKLGSMHPITLGNITNLANICRDIGNLSEAESLYRRVLEGFESTFGPEHSSTLINLNNLAHLLTEKRDFTGAELLYRRAIAGFEKALGSDHPDTLNSVNHLGIWFNGLGRFVEALDLLRGYSVKSPIALAGVRYNLACYECLSGNHDEARRLIGDEIATHPKKKVQALGDSDLAAIHSFIESL